MNMKTLKTLAAAIVLCALGCQKSDSGKFLGSAVVEAETWQVPALVSGPLSAVFKGEGDSVRAGELLAWVDTVPYALQYSEAEAGLSELGASVASKFSEIGAVQAEVHGMDQDSSRLTPLSQAGAATPQQMDKLATGQDAARHKLDAVRSAVQGLDARKRALHYRLESLLTQLRRCRVLAPAAGFVLTRYRNAGEAVAPGQAVFELGRRDSVHADFFVPQGTLALLRIGDTVGLRVEGAAAHVPAVIRFIASEAEFTPKNIQTRESRAELVFRVRAEASSQGGLLKRGLPVEVYLASYSPRP